MTNHSPRASHPFWAVLLLATLCSAGEAAASQDVDDLQEQAIREAVRVVSPAVVRIETSGGTEVVGAVRGPRSGVRRGQGPTSGVIVSPDGYVISSAFNFANKPATIRVALPGSKERKVARVVANDQSRMLTLLKIADLTPGTKLPVAMVAPRGEIQIGQTAIAVGRTLSQEADGPANVSVGIVSALDRIWGRALQTDAKISPTNYGGPLVDLQGRVMGILVPASPQAEGETAGFEWYDSGIGFAVPLEDVLQALPRMVKGSEKEPVVLKRGFLGITMRSQDMFEAQPIIGTVMPGSAAEKAGMKPGDLVMQIDGKPVRNHAQVMHRLGGKYEGDAVAIQVEREKKPVDFARVILGSPESAYPQAFLGILPMRDDPTPGVEVRHVFEKSPAELAKIQVGDRIQKVQVPGAPPNAPMAPLTRGRDQLMGLLEMLRPGQELKLELKRKDTGKEETVTVKLAEAPDQVPARLPETRSAKKALVKPAEKPAAKSKDGDKPAEKPDPAKEAPAKAPPAKDKVEKVETGFQKKTTAAADSTYWVYIPETYDPNISCAMVVWLHPLGKNKEKDIEDFAMSWANYCDENHIILVCPQSENPRGWTPGEADSVVEIVRSVLSNYTIDQRRVVAHGMGVGGEMAYYLGFQIRALIRGVATVGANLGSNPREKVPNQPLAFFLAVGEKDPIKPGVQQTRTRLSSFKYPVIEREIPNMGHEYLDGKVGLPTLEELIRWIDSMDRL